MTMLTHATIALVFLVFGLVIGWDMRGERLPPEVIAPTLTRAFTLTRRQRRVLRRNRLTMTRSLTDRMRS